MRFSFNSQQPPPPRLSHQPYDSQPLPPAAAQSFPAAPLSPPLPPHPSPVPAVYGVDETVLGHFDHYTAPNSAFGRTASPSHLQSHTAENPFVFSAGPSAVESSSGFASFPPLTQPLAPHPFSAPDYQNYSTASSSTIHTTHTTHVIHPSLASPSTAALSSPLPDIDADLRRAVLTDPFNLFCPAGLDTVPAHPHSSGAFLPLVFVDKARTKSEKSEELESGPCWSIYLYGPQQRVVAFCLHADCVLARQEETPFRGFMCPPNKMTMNRHYREQHHMFDPRLDEKGESGEDASPRSSKRRKARQPSNTAAARKAAKTGTGHTPHVKAEEGGPSGKEEAPSASTPRRRQKMSEHSTSKTWRDHAALQSHAPTTPVWQLPPSDSSAYSSSSSSHASSSSSHTSSPSSSSSSPASSASSPSDEQEQAFVSLPPSSSAEVTRNRLRSVVYPYNLMSAMRGFGSFLFQFIRLHWNLLASQVGRLSQSNDLGRLVAQLHIHNTHEHTVRIQTAAGLISDNDGVCPTRRESTEVATRMRGVRYEVSIECRECNRRRMDVLQCGRHYTLLDSLELREMSADEYAEDGRRTRYALPEDATSVGVMRLEGDVFEEARGEMEARYRRWYAAQQAPRDRM